MLVWLYLYW